MVADTKVIMVVLHGWLAYCLNRFLNVKTVVATFNQEKALVGAFSVITNLRMELFEALLTLGHVSSSPPLSTTPPTTVEVETQTRGIEKQASLITKVISTNSN